MMTDRDEFQNLDEETTDGGRDSETEGDRAGAAARLGAVRASALRSSGVGAGVVGSGVVADNAYDRRFDRARERVRAGCAGGVMVERASRAQTLSYLREMSGEFAAIANAIDCRVLAQLFRIAADETRRCRSEKQS